MVGVTNPAVRTIRAIGSGLYLVAVVITVLMAFLTTFDVLSRSILNKPLVYTFELTEIMMILLGFLGLGYVTAKGKHIEVDIVVPRLPLRAQWIISAFNAFWGAGVFSLIAWRTAKRAMEMWHAGECTMILQLPMAPSIFVVSLSSLIMCLELIIVLVDSVRKTIREDEPAPRLS